MTQLYKAILEEADAAGMLAGQNAEVIPMFVGSPRSLFGNDIDLAQPVYAVPSGVCGFAWVHICKATGPFVSYLKKQNIGHKNYKKGWDIWVSGFGQSMTRKECYASAYAKVLSSHGIDCYSESRMD